MKTTWHILQLLKLRCLNHASSKRAYSAEEQYWLRHYRKLCDFQDAIQQHALHWGANHG